MSVVIKIKNLSKEYKVHQKEPGLLGSIKGLFKREYKTIKAVQDITINIEEGQLVGFIGPNGAGKTTTLKMLAGLLHPTSGDAQVLGFTPWQRKKEFLKEISLVMGQKHQLWWDLPLYDSLLLQRDIYEMSDEEFRTNLAELNELLELEPFMKTQVRKLSLGQRMRGELAAAFVYRPHVLFLDEPTIGLDVIAQRRIRDFILEYQQRHNAAILLTSHYLDDVRQLCKRLIVIDHGKVVFDGSTDELIANHIDHKQVVLTFSTEVNKSDLTPYGTIVTYEPLRAAIQVPRGSTSQQAATMLAKLPIQDIAIEEPRLEDVIRELFSKKEYIQSP